MHSIQPPDEPRNAEQENLFITYGSFDLGTLSALAGQLRIQTSHPEHTLFAVTLLGSNVASVRQHAKRTRGPKFVVIRRLLLPI